MYTLSKHASINRAHTNDVILPHEENHGITSGWPMHCSAVHDSECMACTPVAGAGCQQSPCKGLHRERVVVSHTRVGHTWGPATGWSKSQLPGTGCMGCAGHRKPLRLRWFSSTCVC